MLTQQQINNQLTQQLQADKQRIDHSAIQKQKELSEALAQLRAANEQMLKTKDEQIAQLSAQLEKTKGIPQITEFRVEALQINTTSISQIKLLCQQIAQVEPLCELTTSISEKIEKARTELDQVEETLRLFVGDSNVRGSRVTLPCVGSNNIIVAGNLDFDSSSSSSTSNQNLKSSNQKAHSSNTNKCTTTTPGTASKIQKENKLLIV